MRLLKMGMLVAINTLAFTALGTSAQAAKIYKWVDSAGTVHYSQTKPRQSSAKQLAIRTRPGSSRVPVASTNASSDVKEKSSPQTPRNKKDKRVAELEAKLKKQQEAQNKRRCESLQANIKNLEVGGRIYDMEGGKRKYLDGKQIDERLVDAKARYNQSCN